MPELRDNHSSEENVGCVLQARELLTSLSYYAALPHNEQTALAEALEKSLNIFPQHNLVELERSCPLLPGYKDYFEFIRKCNPDVEVDPRIAYQSLVHSWAGCLAYIGIYSHLQQLGELNFPDIKNLLDLGSGYWNSSYSYQQAFPCLQTAIGVEFDEKKAEFFESRTVVATNLDTSKFTCVVADFFELKDPEALISRRIKQEASFDLVLMQSYFPCPRKASTIEDYLGLFNKLKDLLSENGKLVIIIDQRDYGHSPELTNLRPSLEKFFCRYEDRRIAQNVFMGNPASLEVDVWVADASSLPSA